MLKTLAVVKMCSIMALFYMKPLPFLLVIWHRKGSIYFYYLMNDSWQKITATDRLHVGLNQ